MKRQLCIVLHDVAPATWPLCERLLALVDSLGAPRVTFLGVPDFHGHDIQGDGCIDQAPHFVRAIERRLQRGDEIALHGYTHRDDAPAPRTPLEWLRRRVLTAGEGEFSTLSHDAARAKLESGLQMFARLGWPVAGFVPPAWLASAGTHVALRATDLRYTSNHTAIISLRDGTRLSAPCLTSSPRSACRRAASKLWLRAAGAARSSAPLLRVALHPQDAAHDDLLACWKILLQRLLRERQAVTKVQALESLGAQAPAPA